MVSTADRELPIALGFDEFDGQVEVTPANLYADESHTSRRYVQLLARIGASVRPVIDVPSIVEAIRKNAGLSGRNKE